MKVTKEKLNQIIKEEIDDAIKEGFFDRLFGRGKKEPEAAPEDSCNEKRSRGD